MKKKILIVNKSFNVGGIQSSMINMANELGKIYDIDLFLYNCNGKMKSRLNEYVNVIEPSWRIKALGLSAREALRSNDLKVIIFRMFALVWVKLFGNKFPISIAIKHQPKLTGYDLAIAFHHEMGKRVVTSGFSRVVDKCVDAKRKLAWVHYDPATLELNHNYNIPFYEKMDKVICVSHSVKENFATRYPQLASKTEYCYNFMDYSGMAAKGDEEQEIKYPDGGKICFSACRLNHEKAIVRAIKAFAPVFREYKDLYWYIAGDGPEKEKIKDEIGAQHLAEQIILMGNTSNPYPYMKNANVVMNVSYHEAAPMLYMESKAMGTPLFATETSSTEEMLTDGVDAFVCENNGAAMREKFMYMIKNFELLGKMKASMNAHSMSNEPSIKRIEEFIRSE